MRWDSMSKSIWTDEKRDKMRWVSKDEREERWEIRWVSQSRCTDEKRDEMRWDEMSQWICTDEKRWDESVKTNRREEKRREMR